MSSNSSMTIPTTIGSYQIIRQIGQGGMGIVYEGILPDIERRVAIKILLPEYAHNKDIASRFLNEARAANRVSHPGMVNIFETGQTADGIAYIVMEYLDGESLAHRILQNRSSLGGDALRLGRQIASVLSAVHVRGIVHRDIKPENIMIVRDPESPGGERVRILDFGIAKLSSELTCAAMQSQPHTRTGMMLGTPQYMAPEQCRSAGKVDSKVDVYALGIILYEILAGQPPFAAEGIGELIAMHLYREPTPLADFVPSVSAQLSSLVQAMLCKEPTGRPSMAEAAAALEELGAPKATNAGELVNSAEGSVVRAVVNRSHWITNGSGQALNRSTQVQKGRALHSAAAVLVFGVVALGVYLQFRSSPGAPAASNQVTWRIDSAPSGATVMIDEGNAKVCTTPCVQRRVRRAGFQSLLLRKSGYLDQRIEMSLSQDEQRSEHLDPLSSARVEVKWRIQSEPSGADVVRVKDNLVLGQTPWEQTGPKEAESQNFVLRLSRYQDRYLTLNGAKDENRTELLIKQTKEAGNARDNYAIPVH